MGIVGSAPQVSPMSNSENPFASLRVSIPSPTASISSSASAPGAMAVSTAPSLAWPVPMQAPAYPAAPSRNFANHEFGRPSGTFAVSASDSHPTYGRLVSPTDEILSGTGFAVSSSSAASKSPVSLMPPPATIGGGAPIFLQRSSQSIVTEPRLTATPFGGGPSGVRQPALVEVVSRSETATASTFPTISRTQSMYQRRDQDIVTGPLLTATPLGGGPSGARQPVPVPVVSSFTTTGATASSTMFPRVQQSRLEQTWSLNPGSTPGPRGGGSRLLILYRIWTERGVSSQEWGST
jgi:hypothetical protein